MEEQASVVFGGLWKNGCYRIEEFGVTSFLYGIGFGDQQTSKVNMDQKEYVITKLIVYCIAQAADVYDALLLLSYLEAHS